MTIPDQTTKNIGPECRVLVVCNDAEYFLRRRLAVVTHLTSLGAEVTVITGSSTIPANLVKGWKYIRLRIERFAFSPVRDTALMARTSREIWSLKPDDAA